MNIQQFTINKIFVNMVKRMEKDKDAIIIAPTYYPETCSILQEISKISNKNLETLIVGGNDKEPLFKDVQQIPVNFKCSGVDSENDENTKNIIDTIPVEKLNNRKIYLYQFMHYPWRKFLEERIKRENINCEIVADMTQGFEAFFEGKHNLPKVLDSAKLSSYKIPSTTIAKNKLLTDEEILNLYNSYKGGENKIVLQLCGDTYQEIGGGEGTKIKNNYEDFKDTLLNMIEDHPEADIKISKYILGIEGNFSFLTLLKTNNNTVAKVSHELNTEEELLNKAKEAGIIDSTNICGRMTLKCVGEPLLTSKSGSGVGNDLGFIHSEEVRDFIIEIGQKLGSYMAKTGKWGLAGCDVKVSPDGHVYIIEINNRQQGPTAQMSEDAERNGLPSLIKMHTIYAFGSPSEVQELHDALEGHEEEISKRYSSNGGSFYVKVATTENSIIKTPFKPGFYKVKKVDNDWQWDLENPIEIDMTQEKALNFNQKNSFDGNELILELRAGAPKKGLELPVGNQICRIVGLSNKNFPSPFTINDDKTKVIVQLNWRSLITSFKENILDKAKIPHVNSNEFIEIASTQPRTKIMSDEKEFSNESFENSITQQNSNINIAERSAFRNHYSINIELSTNSFSSKLLAKNTNLKENCNFIINN